MSIKAVTSNAVTEMRRHEVLVTIVLEPTKRIGRLARAALWTWCERVSKPSKNDRQWQLAELVSAKTELHL